MIGEDDEEFMMIGRAVVADDWATNILAAIEAHKINMTRQSHVPFEFTIERVDGPFGRVSARLVYASEPNAGKCRVIVTLR